MANLDSVLKSKDITLPTKICLVKAMVFPVVMYGCDSLTQEIGPGCSLDGLMLKLKLQYFGHLMRKGVGDGQGGLACCNSWGRKESDTTERLN